MNDEVKIATLSAKASSGVEYHSAEKVIRYISSVFRGDIHGIEENSEVHVS